MKQVFAVSDVDRLDRLVVAQLGMSRRRAQQWIKCGWVAVNDQVVPQAGFRPLVGAQVSVWGTHLAGVLPHRVGVIHRDPSIIVIDKPSGLPSQGTRDSTVVHVFAILQERFSYAGLHHRLDTPASGLMMLSLDRAANRPMTEALRAGRIDRRYRVVVVGSPGEEGVWDNDLEGQTARTRWRCLSRQQGMSVLECHLETGRTHQIRRHAQLAGCPVIGDRRYGGAAGRLWKRLALHAYRLGFVHPVTAEVMDFVSSCPSDLAPLLERAGLASD